MESSCALALKGGLQGLQGQTESWQNVLKETPVSRIIEVNPSLWKYFSLKNRWEKKTFFPCSKAPNFLRRNLLTRFFFAVIRPRRKTPGSPSIDDRGHNNCGIPTFLTKHGDKPLQSHQDIRGGGTATVTDVTPPPPSWSKMTSGCGSYLPSSGPGRTSVAQPSSHAMKMDVQTSTRYLFIVVSHSDPVKAVAQN